MNKTFQVLSMLMLITFAGYGQNCVEVCDEMLDRVSTTYFQSGIKAMQNGTDSIRVLSLTCEACYYPLYGALEWLAYASEEVNDFDTQKKTIQELQTIFPKVHFKDTVEKFQIYQDLQLRTGNYYYSIGALNKAKQTYQNLTDSLLNCAISQDDYSARRLNMGFIGLGNIQIKKRNYFQAQKFFQYAIDKNKKEYTTFCHLGSAFERQGALQKAYDAYDICNQPNIEYIQKHPIEEVAVFSYYFIPPLRRQASIALRIRELEKAQNLLSMIQSIQKKDNPTNARNQLLWAKYFREVGSQDSVDFYMNKAWNHVKNLSPSSELVLDWKLQKAQFLIADGQKRKALELLNSSISDIEKNKNISNTVRNQAIDFEIERINLLYSINPKECLHNIAAFQKKILENLKQDIIFEDHINKIEDYYPILELGLSLIYEQFPKELDLAFSLIECTKSIQLYKENINAQRESDAADSLLISYKIIAATTNQLRVQKSQGDTSIFTANRLFESERKLEKIKRKLQERNATPLFEVGLSLAVYKKELHSKQLHLLFFRGKNHYYWLAVSRSSVKFHQIAIREIENYCQPFIHLINQPDSPMSDILTLGNQLFRQLPLTEIPKNITSILISADGCLTQLPFGSLVDNQKKYLIEDYNISYTPSALMRLLLERKTILEKKNISTGIYLPLLAEKKNLGLKYAKEEANKIKDITGGTLFSRERATKNHFLASCEQYDILHLAAHAKSVKNDASLSYVQFNKEQLDEDKYLYCDEISALRFNTEMVCLSACQTGTGKNYSGEGMQSIARNFIASGCRSVVSTLWVASDKSISEIIPDFYALLFEGKDKSTALAMAKRNYLKNHSGDARHPYYWSEIILTGSTQPVVASPPTLLIWSILGGGMLLIAGLFYRKSNR